MTNCRTHRPILAAGSEQRFDFYIIGNAHDPSIRPRADRARACIDGGDDVAILASSGVPVGIEQCRCLEGIPFEPRARGSARNNGKQDSR